MAKRAAREIYDSDRLIPAVGPTPCDGLLVGEAGGETEHHQRRPFCGKTGSVLTTYLRAANLPRPNIRITNTYPFWTGPGNPDPTPDQIHREEWRLKKEIEKCRPKIIGTVGRIATRWFLGDVDMDTTHGIPHWSDKAPGACILPIVHPAAGFYRPESAAYSQDDLMTFAFLLLNPANPKEVPQLKVVLVDKMPAVIRRAAVDTEGVVPKCWGLSWSLDGITCYVYIWDGKPIKTQFIDCTFHNVLADLPVLRHMGVDTSKMSYGDTMVMLYLRQLEPQGLKAAAYRHLGLRMLSFDDVVRPHFHIAALDYLRRAVELKYQKPKPEPIADYTKRKWRLYKPWDAGRRVKSALTSWDKRQALIADGMEDDKPIRLEKKWKDLGEAFQEEIEMRMGEPAPDFSIFCVPRKQAVQYSGIDAGATKLLEKPLLGLLKQHNLLEVYETDRRYIPFVDKMQETGMRVEVSLLRELESEMEVLREKARDKVQRIVGDRWFNPGSDDQVGRWLYKVKGLPILKYTEGGEGSTSLVTLKMLQGYHGKDNPDVMEFTAGVREYRETDKYLGTFIVPIFEYMKRDRNGDWRIHPNYRITRVVSGRNSSHDPNVMAFPTRTELGKKIRLCFRARYGYKIVAVDASQIELRMMAHLCRDKRMRDAFEQGLDLHSITASELFKVPLQEFLTKPRAPKREAQRYVAKTINFAVMYGISARALLEQLYKADIFDYTLEDCQRFIDQWFRLFGSVKVFLHEVWAKAQRDGFVRDMWGRMCYVPNLRVGDDRMRESAQRLAGNMPVQGGARGLVKRAQIRTHEWLSEEDRYSWAHPWLDMHDELTSEVQEDRAEEFALKVQGFFCADQDRMKVPIKAEYGIGDSWGSAK